MNTDAVRQVQIEGADALLDVGVSVPIASIRVPFKKKPVEIRVTMKRPCLAGQIKIARTYLSMGVTSEEMWRFSKEDEMRFLSDHGNKIAKMIAITICRGALTSRLFLGLMTWLVKTRMSNAHLIGAMKRFVTLMGTDPFIPIIKSAEMTNPMKPRTSQKSKGS
jgi:hypothetical protein